MPPEDEDLLDIDNPINEGDEYSPDHYWAEKSYEAFEAYMEDLKQMIWEEKTYGGIWDEADRLGEEEYYRQIADEKDWEDHLNPIEAFEQYHTILINEYGMYPDSHDRYEYMDLVGQEIVDDVIGAAAAENEDQCTSW